MEPYGTTTAEALRWLVTAEKLLAAKDFVGSKTFAIRARDSDPRLDYADQILAIVDTLIAAERRINDQLDWYAILQLPRWTQDMELIASHYRRLVLLLNPTRNKLVYADQAFKLVVDAWSVLSNPSKKSFYDNDLNNLHLNSYSNPIGSGSTRQQEHHPSPPLPFPTQTQQQPQQVTRSPAKNDTFQTRSDVLSNEKNVAEDSPTHCTQNQTSTFWTTCPYCYNIYEYPRVYAECVLQCQNCRRAFQAVVIPSPPPIVDGQEAYLCCWGFFPVGVSMSNSKNNKAGASNWTPFSQMFSYPQVAKRNVGRNGRVEGTTKKASVRKTAEVRVYADDEDVFVEVSEPSDDSDDDWGSARKTKKAKSVKKKGSTGKNIKNPQVDKAKNAEAGNNEDLQSGFVFKEPAGGVPKAPVAESSKKATGSNVKRQPGRVVKDLGKLDLNVEFSNEVEEPVGGNKAANREEDNIEGIGFFEGLDEFLSSLPILSVVGDDKVKAG